MARQKIHFEDQGQDFLWFIVDHDGTVEEAGPFQHHLWVGKTGTVRLFDGGRRYFVLSEKGQPLRPIRYPVTQVEEL